MSSVHFEQTNFLQFLWVSKPLSTRSISSLVLHPLTFSFMRETGWSRISSSESESRELELESLQVLWSFFSGCLSKMMTQSSSELKFCSSSLDTWGWVFFWKFLLMSSYLESSQSVILEEGRLVGFGVLWFLITVSFSTTNLEAGRGSTYWTDEVEGWGNNGEAGEDSTVSLLKVSCGVWWIIP